MCTIIHKGRAKNTDPRLTFQWGNKCCRYCPRSVRECLRCGAAECDDNDSDSESGSSDEKDDGGQVDCKQVSFTSEDFIRVLKTMQQYNIFDLRRHNSLQATRQRRRLANMGVIE